MQAVYKGGIEESLRKEVRVIFTYMYIRTFLFLMFLFLSCIYLFYIIISPHTLPSSLSLLSHPPPSLSLSFSLPQVWPYLLGLHSHSRQPPPVAVGDDNMEQLSYSDIIQTWRTLEYYHYKNNDPTSTSFEIRRGFTPPTVINPQVTPTSGHETIPIVPDMIILDEDEKDGHVTLNDCHMTLNDDHVTLSDDSGCEDSLSERLEKGLTPHPQPEGEELSPREREFLEELVKIDKDIPRCDRDYM